MNLLPLMRRIEQHGLGEQGVSLFVNMMPAEAEAAILLRSPLAGTRIDYELPGFYQTQFQLVVRSHGYPEGDALIAQAIAALSMTETQVEQLLFRYSRPHTEPVVFPLSKGNLLEFSVLFDCCYVVVAP